VTTTAATLPFQLLSDQATLPTRAHPGDAGLDLYAAEAVRIEPGERRSVGTGVAVALPPGTAGLVVPRSGLAARHGIALVNAPGVIDAGYRGELRVLLLNTDAAEPFAVSPGDRVAQLLVVRVDLPEPVAVAALGTSARGDGGFGSSGIT
jgi:dUTP pyrophosphatase